MTQAFLIHQGLEEFAAAREQFSHLVSELQSAPVLGMQHGDVESLISREGTELLRRLLQGHLDLRSAREGDVIWRVRAGEDWLYVYLLIEFQSAVDRLMAVRLLTYLGLLYQDLERRVEGREEALAAERRMLLRLIERRFGAETASAAEPLLEPITRPESLEPIGEAIIDALDPEDFLARVRALPSERG